MSTKKRNRRVDVTEEFFPKNYNVGPSFNLKEFNWTEKQQNFIRALLNHRNKIVLCKAPAGVGKTLCSIYAALKLIKEGKADKIIYVRNPVESASKGLGFLPGELKDKMSWVIQPLMDQLTQLLNKYEIDQILKDEIIQGVPLGYIKGTSNIRTIMIVDEIADLNVQELLLCLTRIGKDSKIFLVGDLAQCHVKNGGFSQVFNLFNDDESRANGIATFQFGIDDIMRNEVLKYVISKFERIS